MLVNLFELMSVAFPAIGLIVGGAVGVKHGLFSSVLDAIAGAVGGFLVYLIFTFCVACLGYLLGRLNGEDVRFWGPPKP